MNLIERFTKEEGEDFGKLTSTEARRLFCQYKFKVDFPAFVYLLGYRDLGEFHKAEMDEISKFRLITSESVRRLWLWSRGFFKTSLITEAHTLWLIVNNPNIRILIVSYTLDIAKKALGTIRNTFTSNEEFRYFFKEFCPIPNKEGKIEFCTSEYITIPNRTKSYKEPTAMCAGIGTNLVGLHFDVIKTDDLVNKDSVQNDAQVLASKEYYSMLRPLYDNPTIPREDVIGTIYHFNDLHSSLMKSSEFQKSFIPAHRDGKFTFPERLDEKGWEKLVNDPTQSPYSIQSQWLLNPIDPAKSLFKEEWVTFYDIKPEGLAEYITVDPASTQKKKSDYTVIQRWGIDSKGYHYLLEGTRDKVSAFQRIGKLFQFVRNAKNLKWVKYEVLGGRHGDLEVIKERQAKEALYFFIKETKSTTASKKDRIVQRLQGVYNSRLILFPRNLFFKSEYDGTTYDFVQLFKLELLQYPFTEHDDILDCQSQMFEEELIKGKETKLENNKKWGTADDWERLYKEIDVIQKNNPFGGREWAMNRIRVKRFKEAVRSI